MDASSGGSGDKDGDSDATSSSSGVLGTANLHDHSDLLIPNPSFLSSPASSTSSSMMSITSPSSDVDLQSRQVDCQMTSPQESMPCEEASHMDCSLQQVQPDSSPPNVIVDDSPLQPCMDRNKESLKVKLLMRRPMNQLVEQGILPPPKTPAAFAGQRVRLERARMGDLLKAKIQQRPARQELIRQHILEDTDSRVAPLLAEKQRMLKRARLADSLNDHLIHRPGPLELVQKNILHAPDADIEKAIKDGIVSFKATSEGHVPGPSLPNKYTVNEDDSNSSDISSPAGTPDALSSGPNTEANTPISKQPSDSAINSIPSAPSTPTTEVCDVTLQPAKTNKSETTPQLILTTTTIPSAVPVQPKLTPATIFHVTTPTAVIPPPPPLPATPLFITPTAIPPPPPPPQTIVLSDGAVRELLPQLQNAGFQLAAAAHVQKPSSQSSSSLGKSRSSKKSSKSKSQPKTRTIKFHEYKGPSSLQQKLSANSPGTSSSAQSSAESSYELLLKQQQLFLQWQLEWQHKYPQILLPAAPKVTGAPSLTSSTSTKTMSSFPVTTIPASLCTNLINNQQSSSQQATGTIAVAAARNNASPKPIPVTLAPKIAEIVPKPAATETTDSKAFSNEFTLSTSDIKPVNPKPLNLSSINEWKVNDLKAELKKRSLPVSGSKSQLVERLKSAVAKESDKISPVTVKMDVTSADENSSEGMDVSGSNNDELESSNKVGNAPSVPSPATATVVIGTSSPENNNVSVLDLANRKLNGVPISLQNILSLLGVSSGTLGDGKGLVISNNNPAADNNLKNVSVPPGIGPATSSAKVITQLPISTVVATPAKSATIVGNESPASNAKLIDENKILEQEKQIEDLQEALRISQQQLRQLAQQKDAKNGGPQKYRLVLQQHIQQKLQQQAFQAQLQNLIQLQTQQAELKRQHQLLQQQQQQQQVQQPQAQLVLIRGNNQPVTIANNVLPVTIVSTSAPIGISHQHWVQNHNEELEKSAATHTAPEEGRNLNITELAQTMDTKIIPKLEPAESEPSKSSVKSQMVDDVLEILIRNGELPPSAAQDPHAKGHLAQSISGTEDNAGRTSTEPVQPPPPPPPLPPPTFSVMLPTTIPFSRHQTGNNTDFLSFGQAGRAEETLSKDAQEILRICEDLSNFGKSQEAEAAAAAAVNLRNSNPTSNIMNSGFFSVAPGADNKLCDLPISAADSMDVGFGDTHSLSLHSSSSTGSNKAQSNIHSQHNLFHGPPNTDAHFDSGTFSFSQQPHVNTSSSLSLKPHSGDHQQNHFMGDDDLLPVSLDMQMDTDYSDWLDALLPDSTNPAHIAGNSTSAGSTGSNLFQMDHHNTQQADAVSPGKIISAKRQEIPQSSFLQSLQNNDNNNLSSANSTSNYGISNNVFGSLLDDNSHHEHHHHSHGTLGHQRDPLLSSRSFAPRATVPFGELQSNNFPFAHHHHHNSVAASGLLFPPTSSSSQSAATLMDTDFDDLSSTCSNAKKSENNIILNNATTNIITEMPSSNPTPITTSSINDNFLWDFAM